MGVRRVHLLYCWTVELMHGLSLGFAILEALLLLAREVCDVEVAADLHTLIKQSEFAIDCTCRWRF